MEITTFWCFFRESFTSFGKACKRCVMCVFVIRLVFNPFFYMFWGQMANLGQPYNLFEQNFAVFVAELVQQKLM